MRWIGGIVAALLGGCSGHVPPAPAAAADQVCEPEFPGGGAVFLGSDAALAPLKAHARSRGLSLQRCVELDGRTALLLQIVSETQAAAAMELLREAEAGRFPGVEIGMMEAARPR